MSRHKKSPPKGPAPAGSTNAGASAQAREDYSKFSQSVKRGGIRTGQTTERPAYWAVLPASVRYDEKLPASAKLLFAEISSLAEATGFCFASNEYFAGLYAMSERTVQRHIKALESGGHIVIVDGDGGSGRRKIYAGANPLRGNPDKNDGVPEGTPTKMSPNPDKNVASTLYNKNNNYTPQSPPGGGDGSGIWDKEAFDRFWAMYPKKRDKAKAIKEWNRLKADRKLMRRMSAALGAQMASEEWQRDNGRAIPYPCRWLSHRRWEDELGVEIPQQKEDDRVWL